MRLKENEVTLKGRDGDIIIKRNAHGIPEITAQTLHDLAWGQGWTQAADRQLQALLTRVILQGRAAELLKGDDELVAVDRYMRTLNFLPDPEAEIEKLLPETRAQLEAHAAGMNFFLSQNKPIHEFRLLGFQPEPWHIRDALLLGKAFGFIGLAESQGAMEKLLTQMIQNKVERAKIRELFPYLTEKIDYAFFEKIKLGPPLVPEAVKWLGKIPRLRASNNWAISGGRSMSGKPILCGDPHLEVNRLPAIWQEIVLRLPGRAMAGVSLPGAPGLILGRTDRIAWSATYAFMDMLDYRVERCREGMYERRGKYIPFQVRREEIKVKKKAPQMHEVYENDLGVLEGDPFQEGCYLISCWSARQGCGADVFNSILRLPDAANVREAMDIFKQIESCCFNFVMADRDGAIGYQMSGRLFDRPVGVSGLMPLPAWDQAYDSKGFVDKDKLPRLYNPKDGVIVTANNDLNHLGQAEAINLPMGAYRAERITRLLKVNKKLNVEYMKKMHFDLYSVQAARLMDVIRPLLPETENGFILKEWNCRYESDSKGAMLFESVYLALINAVFGDHGFGRDVIEYLFKESTILNDYYANFDHILLREDSAWFQDQSREEIFRPAINVALRVEAKPYGADRKIMLTHLLFGGKVPGFLGYDIGPIELPGSRATIPQGQVFKSAGRTTTFSPSYRMIADLAGNELHTTLAGGPSDRRFSKWYAADLENWQKGRYKILK
ncbi:MAG: penicillin acylase family protein [Pseudomonadota bacterium]